MNTRIYLYTSFFKNYTLDYFAHCCFSFRAVQVRQDWKIRLAETNCIFRIKEQTLSLRLHYFKYIVQTFIFCSHWSIFHISNWRSSIAWSSSYKGHKDLPRIPTYKNITLLSFASYHSEHAVSHKCHCLWGQLSLL